MRLKWRIDCLASGSLIKAFWIERSGSTAVIFAFTLLALMGSAGVALDFSRSYSAKVKFQAAVDAAVLSVASLSPNSTIDRGEQAKAEFQRYIQQGRATSTDGKAKNISSSWVDGVIALTVVGEVETTLMKVAGFSRIPFEVAAAASSKRPGKAEIALVLDYSGSMKAKSKYITMRDAAIQLVQDLMGATAQAQLDDIEDVRIGLVPFSEFVYTDISSTFIRDVHSDKYGVNVRACLDSRRHPYTIQSSTPVSDLEDSKWPAPGMPEEWAEPGPVPLEDVNMLATDDSVCTPEPKTAEECTAERDALVASGGLNTDSDKYEEYVKRCTGTSPVSNSDQCQKSYTLEDESKQDAEAVVSDFASFSPHCNAYRDRNLQVQPLTSDHAALTSQLSLMAPVRLTNIALGLEFGWHLLTQNGPFPEAAVSDSSEILRAVVLLTDGKQTVGGWGSNSAFGIPGANANTLALCQNIKANGIKVFTIGYDLAGNAAVLNMLQQCASDPSRYFYDSQTDADLASAFKEITDQLSKPVALVK